MKLLPVRSSRVLLLPILIACAGCGATARLAVSDGTGPSPVLPAPKTSLLPKIHVVDAKGWPSGEIPQAATWRGGASSPDRELCNEDRCEARPSTLRARTRRR